MKTTPTCLRSVDHAGRVIICHRPVNHAGPCSPWSDDHYDGRVCGANDGKGRACYLMPGHSGNHALFGVEGEK